MVEKIRKARNRSLLTVPARRGKPKAITFGTSKRLKNARVKHT